MPKKVNLRKKNSKELEVLVNVLRYCSIFHSMISQNHSEMPRDKIVDHNPVSIYLHCKESARDESQLWSNV